MYVGMYVYMEYICNKYTVKNDPTYDVVQIDDRQG